MAALLPSTAVRPRAQPPRARPPACTPSTLTGHHALKLVGFRITPRGELVIVAAKGKGKKGSQASFDESFYEEEIANLPPLEFVIEEDDEFPAEDDWKAKKGKGKGKKQKKKSSWDEEDDVYTPPAFSPPPAAAASSFVGPVPSAPSVPFEEEDGAFVEEPAAKPQLAQPSRSSYGETGGGYNTNRGAYGQGGLSSTRGNRPAGQRGGDRAGWYDPEKRKAWADKRARVFSRVTTQEINAAGTWEEVADILQARDKILDHIHITAALTVVSKVTDLNALQENDQERFEQLLATTYRKLYELVNKLGPREIATNLLSLARLGYTSDEVVQALLNASLPKLKQFNAIELSNAIYALGQMSYVPIQDWTDTFFEASEAKLPEFKPLELANSINALAQLNQLPPPSWLDAFFAQAQATLNGFTSRDTATMLYGLGLLGARPADEWLLACTAASMRGLKGGRVTDLKRGVWALSQFDYTPDFKWQNTFVGRAKSLLDYFSAEDLLTTTLAMAYLRFSVVDPDFVRRLVSKIQERRGRYDEESLGNLNNALQVLGHKGAAIQPVASKVMAVAA